MMHPVWLTNAIFVADWVIRISLATRVIMRRRSVGVALAWLTVILILPFVGAGIYLFFGELRLGRTRAKRAQAIHGPYQAWLESLRHRYPVASEDPSDPRPDLARLIDAGAGFPALPGNQLRLLDATDAIFRSLIEDIDAAKKSCHLEFYIWSNGGWADEVGEALHRAAGRNVTCRLLVDAVGSSAFLGSEAAQRLRAAGVDVQAALPVKAWRFLFERLDLRLHRKIVVIDGQVAYTGSMNIADPRYFKADAGVGEWVDAMVRVRGPVVEALAVTFIEDWELETGVGLESLVSESELKDQHAHGEALVQVLASGPNVPSDAMKTVVLQAIYAAQHELVITTPYFVPEESLLIALGSAAMRGVQVHLVVPAKNDSKLVDLASRAFEGDLSRAGVKIWLFQGGLLHTKSITVDGHVCLFGSLNLDPRSLALNFEITLAVYDDEFTSTLRHLQRQYIDKSTPFDLKTWEGRSFATQFAENSARLVGPLL